MPKPKKTRPDKYEKKLHIKSSLDHILKIAATQADKKVTERQK